MEVRVLSSAPHDSLDVLRSELLQGLGFAHGFNLRTGGASTAAPFASFNLGRSVGDDPSQVEENHRRFAALIGYRHRALHEVSQVHGGQVVSVDAGEDPGVLRLREADALIAGAGAVAIGVRVADCAPVLVGDPESGAAAAVHAGWRGTAAGVVEAAVQRLLQAGSRRQALHAAIFPHIRRCCFEVGEEVAEALAAASPAREVVDRSRAKPHVDLSAILAAKLAALGIAAAQIEDVPGCTRCEPERFFSYRRDGKRSGRHVAAIVSR